MRQQTKDASRGASLWQKTIASGVGWVGVENMHATEIAGEEVGGVLGG